MIALLAAAAQTLSFSCLVDPPRNVVVKGKSVTSTQIGLGPGTKHWRFDLVLTPTSTDFAVTLNWPDDPIGTGEALSALSEGPHDFAFVSGNAGPCVFTVTSCLFMYTLSQNADGTADILIQPSALATDGDRSKPFQVFMEGHCTPKVSAE